MKTDWEKFRQLTFQEMGLLAHALVIVPLISFGLRVLGFKRLKGLLQRQNRNEAQVTGQPLDTMYQIARMTNVVGGRLPLPATCLQRSVALWWMLNQRGIDSAIVIGVHKDDRKLHAHAWVEYAGIVLNDRPEVRSEFTVLDTL
jgi:hypothetical protein